MSGIASREDEMTYIALEDVSNPLSESAWSSLRGLVTE
jgi:hypothetical protein